MASETAGNLYEKIVARAGGARMPEMPPSRASAAVVPWRRNADGTGIEVFWVKRSEKLAFMGGWHAFPGGGLSRSDAAVPVIEPPSFSESTAAASGQGWPESLRGDGELGPDFLPGLAACAVRELFEETGVLLSTPAGAALPGAEDLAAAQQALLGGGKPFAEILAGLGVTADASRLVYAGRWMTPPFAPLRFDNRFFLLEWPREEPLQPAVVPGELESGEWIDPGAAWEIWRRGDALAAPPILHILEVLSQDGPAPGRGLDRLRDPSETNLGPLRRVEMRPGVTMFPLATFTLPPASTTNAYLLGTGEEAVLVDPGSPHDVENDRLERALQAARERLGRKVSAIWLTHHHLDHVGGVERLRKSLGVPVLAHPLTAERLAGQGIRVDGELADGQRIVLAGDPPFPVRVIHTPGHARGHLCFLEETGGSLLAGDMIAGIGTIVVDPPEGDMDDYLASLEKMIALAPRTLFPAHGPAVKDAAGKLREYREHRLWREGKVLDAWNAGLRAPGKMVATVYDDVPKEAYPIAERQILAHLARLHRAGKIEGRLPSGSSGLRGLLARLASKR